MASDAFVPFADGVKAAAAACDRLGLAMCFTGARHFRYWWGDGRPFAWTEVGKSPSNCQH